MADAGGAGAARALPDGLADAREAVGSSRRAGPPRVRGDRQRDRGVRAGHVANGGVVVPTAEHALDRDALAIIAAAFSDRAVVGVPSRVIAYGGGGTHCITQQVPATP